MSHRNPTTHTVHRRLPADTARQVFTFFIKSNSVTRATVTIDARDLDVAWSRLRTLFPDADLNDTVVQSVDRH